jgi:hypothetical protein
MNRLQLITEQVNARKATLDERRAKMRQRLQTLTPSKDVETLAAMFEVVTFGDFNAVALEAAFPDVRFGFQQHDARFMRSLRDQTLGNGEAARPLTRAQLATVRTILQREPYLTQVALMLDMPEA